MLIFAKMISMNLLLPVKTHCTQSTAEAAIYTLCDRFIAIRPLTIVVVRSHHHHHSVLRRAASISPIEMPVFVVVVMHQPRDGHQLCAKNVVDVDVDVAAAAVDHNHFGQYLHQNNGI